MACQKLLKNCFIDFLLLYRRELGPRSKHLNSRNGECGSETEVGNTQKKELNHLQIFSVAFVAFILTFLQGWIQLLVKARIVYIMTFFESALILGILYVNPWSPRQMQKSFGIGLIKQRGFLVLGILQSLFVIWFGSYVKHSAAAANRSDPYELFLVLTVPSTIICTQLFNNFDIRAAESLILSITGIKLLVLCRDPIFLPHAVGSISCMFISIVHGLLLAWLYSQLCMEHIVSILQQLAAWKIPVAFLLAVYNGEEIQQLWSLRVVSILVLMAFLSLAKVASTLLLLKYSNPLCCVITTNLAWIPLTLIRAFSFKFLFLISSFKLIFLFILELIVFMFKYELDRFFEKLKNTSSDEYNSNR